MTSPSRLTCRRRFGRGECGGPIELLLLPGGRVMPGPCPWCAKYEQGLCFECGRPVHRPRARRCPMCWRKARRAAGKRWRTRHPERDRLRRLKPEAIAAKKARARRWRDNNPIKVALAVRRIREDPARRAHKQAYLRQWRAKNPEKIRAINARRRGAWARLRETQPERYRQLIDRQLARKSQRGMNHDQT